MAVNRKREKLPCQVVPTMRIFPGDDEFMGCAAGYTLTRTSRNQILFMYGHSLHDAKHHPEKMKIVFPEWPCIATENAEEHRNNFLTNVFALPVFIP